MRPAFLSAALLFACSGPPAARPPQASESPGDQRLNAPDVHLALELPPLAALDPPPPPWDDNPLAPYLGTLVGGVLNSNLGQALEDYLAENFSSIDVARYGLSLLTLEEFAAYCDAPAVTVPFSSDGQDWTTRFELPINQVFTQLPERYDYRMDSTCRTALQQVGSNIDAAVGPGRCFLNQEAAFFPEGSECRACLEELSGDWDGCVAAERCPTSTDLYFCWGPEGTDPVCFPTLLGQTLSCAPDHLETRFVLTRPAEGEEQARPFRNEEWVGICRSITHPEAGGFTETCSFGGSLEGTGFVQGVAGAVQYVRPVGEQGNLNAGRPFHVTSIELTSGQLLEGMWLEDPGPSEAFAPSRHEDTSGDGEIGPGDLNYGFMYGGAGLAPWLDRPDGDPMARDTIAAMALVAAVGASTETYSLSNHSRCTEGSWTGPHANGVHHCAQLGPPAAGWLNDGAVIGTPLDSGGTVRRVFDLAALGSTGVPDPDVPGGFIIHLASTPGLGDDPCVLESTFAPDIALMGDGTIQGQTYRFGTRAEDLRVVLSTSVRPALCAAPSE